MNFFNGFTAMARGMRMVTITVVGAVLVPVLASAQVRPAPPAPPVPPVAPAPRMPDTLSLTAPLLAELERLGELQTLDDFRLLSGDLKLLALDDLKASLADLKLSGKLVDLEELHQALQQAQSAQGTAAREATREAERARQEMERAQTRLQERALTFTTRTGGDYNIGKDLLGQRQYEQAIARFDKVIAQKSANVDGALYWKAYAQYKLAKSDAALATIGQLRKDYPESRYNADARALEADARKMAGQPVNPANLDDDELKLLAISGIQNTDPERAIPLLEGVLNATNSPRVKKQALYVLALSTQPRAHQILLNYAKGAGNPDLQIEAIRYLVANRNKQATSADLLQIYQSSSDTEVKMAIIGTARGLVGMMPGSAFTFSGTGAQPTVVNTTDLMRAIRPAFLLGPAELWTIYEKETNKDLRLQIVNAFSTLQATDQLTRVIKTEKDPDVRLRAVRALGSQKSDKTGQMLVDLYASDMNMETRKAVISALAAQSNAEGLVAIARKEANLELKTDIVRRLSTMAPKSKVAADYLMEIIK